MLIARGPALVLSTLMAGCIVSVAVSADTAVTPATEAGNWTAHKYTFNFMGFTTTYSCEGLEDKLKALLQMNGAGPDKHDVQVVAPCQNQIGRPDKLAFAYLTFSSLQPGSAGSASAGEWKHVTLAPRHPFQFDYGDCELVEQFRDKVLPMFTTRNLTNNVTCVPHQDTGSNYYLSYDVFAPPTPVKR
ncbi:MAG TPA: hypothetical protein VNZ06_07545 [Steroidobacteraceae bacterium]|jgi:hypothetical protein|nr:hypothetical protein [Steroidobacteraceae bacterium]